VRPALRGGRRRGDPRARQGARAPAVSRSEPARRARPLARARRRRAGRESLRSLLARGRAEGHPPGSRGARANRARLPRNGPLNGIRASIAAALALLACSRPPDPAPVAASPTAPPPRTATIVFSSFTTAREAYEKRILPAFRAEWRKRTGVEVEFEPSYGASRSQADAIAAGFEADVAALSLAEDLDRIAAAKKILHDWRRGPNGGIVSRSIVALAVQKGNPKGIRGWTDLAQEGLRIVTPEPGTSGGGRWNLCAVYGSALRGDGLGAAGDAVAAENFLARVFANVVGREKDARSSFGVFEEGGADVAITSESEIRRSRMFGHECEAVIPRSTLRMDNGAAWIDTSVDAHGCREVAEGFVAYLATPEAQKAFAYYGLRPVDPSAIADRPDAFPDVQDLWTIDALGGWSRVEVEVFGAGGVAERILARADR
jgi:sulfate transport system substrate-binding protein